MPSLDSSTQEEKKKANSYAIQHVPSLLFMKIVEIHCAILFLIEIPNVSGGSGITYAVTPDRVCTLYE